MMSGYFLLRNGSKFARNLFCRPIASTMTPWIREISASSTVHADLEDPPPAKKREAKQAAKDLKRTSGMEAYKEEKSQPHHRPDLEEHEYTNDPEMERKNREIEAEESKRGEFIADISHKLFGGGNKEKEKKKK